MKVDGERYAGDAATVTLSSWLPESKPNLAIVNVLGKVLATPS